MDYWGKCLLAGSAEEGQVIPQELRRLRPVRGVAPEAIQTTALHIGRQRTGQGQACADQRVTRMRRALALMLLYCTYRYEMASPGQTLYPAGSALPSDVAHRPVLLGVRVNVSGRWQMLDTSRHQGLQALNGFAFPVYLSSGLEAAARPITQRCERAYRFLSETLQATPTVALLVLSEADWARHAASPTFGVPHNRNGNLIVAGERNSFWQEQVELLRVSPGWEEARQVYGDGQGGLNLAHFFDLIAVHELAHVFAWQGSVRFPRHWLREFFATACLHAYLASVEPDQLIFLETLPRLILALNLAVRHRSLADLEGLYGVIGPLNHVWYQSHLHVAVKALYDTAGVAAVQRLWDTFQLPDDRLAGLLAERVDPLLAQVLTNWPGDRT